MEENAISPQAPTRHRRQQAHGRSPPFVRAGVGPCAGHFRPQQSEKGHALHPVVHEAGRAKEPGPKDENKGAGDARCFGARFRAAWRDQRPACARKETPRAPALLKACPWMSCGFAILARPAGRAKDTRRLLSMPGCPYQSPMLPENPPSSPGPIPKPWNPPAPRPFRLLPLALPLPPPLFPLLP